MANDDLIKPLVEQLGRLKPADQDTLTREYLAKKLPQWDKLKDPERETLVKEVIGKYGKAPEPADTTEPPNWQSKSDFDPLSPEAVEARRRQVEGQAPELADAPVANAVIDGAITGGFGLVPGLAGGARSALTAGVDFGLQQGLQDWVDNRLQKPLARHPYLRQVLATAGGIAAASRLPSAAKTPEFLQKLAQKRALAEPIELAEGSAVPVFEAPKGEPPKPPAPPTSAPPPAPIELRDVVEPESASSPGPVAAPQTPAQTVLGMAAGQTPPEVAPAAPAPVSAPPPAIPATPAQPPPTLPAGFSAAPGPASTAAGVSPSAVGVPRLPPRPPPPTAPAPSGPAPTLPVGYSFRPPAASQAAPARAPGVLPQVGGREALTPAPQPQQEIQQAVARGDHEAAQTALHRELERHPSATVYDMKVGDMARDPDRFQYKTLTDRATGADPALRDIKRYRPGLGGIITVFHDADGQFYVDNGHGRAAALERLEGPAAKHRVQVIEARAKDDPAAVPGAIEYGYTPEQARAYGAVINIAEGRGTALDAARFFRQQGMNTEEMENAGIALTPTEEKTQRAVALSRLSPTLFRAVEVGMVPERLGITIGRELGGEAALQDGLYQQLKKKSGSLGDLTAGKLAEMIRVAKGSATTKQTVVDLFGKQERTKSLIAEQADVIGGIKARLKDAKTLFGTSAKGAQQLEEAGVGKIDAETGERLSGVAAQNLELLNRVAYSSGPVNQVIREAARQVAENPARKARIIADTYAKVTTALGQVMPEVPAEAAPEPQSGLFGTPAAPAKPAPAPASPTAN